VDAGSAQSSRPLSAEEPPPGGSFVFVVSRAVARGTLTASNAKGGQAVSILWIILIVVLVLALLGFFSRGYW
jgi:hypothetical protein